MEGAERDLELVLSSNWNFQKNHPLLNDVILKTLVLYIHTKDLPTCRRTCQKWLDWVDSNPRFRREFRVDLSGNSNTVASRKTSRFIYAMPSPSVARLPFESFKISETRLNATSVDRAFLTHFVPRIRVLHLSSFGMRNLSVQNFRRFLTKLNSLEEIELAISPEITSARDTIFSTSAKEHKKFEFPNLKRVKWLPIANFEGFIDEDEVDLEHGYFSIDFLTEFYSLMKSSVQSIDSSNFNSNLLKESWKHLQALVNLQSIPAKALGVGSGSLQNLKALHFSSLQQRDIQLLTQLTKADSSTSHGLQLSEFQSLSFSQDVKYIDFNHFLELQSPFLNSLQIGWASKSREDVLEIKLPKLFPQLRQLHLRLSSKMKYERINFGEIFPQLKELSVELKDEKEASNLRIYFWEDLIAMSNFCKADTQTSKPDIKNAITLKPVLSLWKLELNGVPLRYSESLYDLMRLFPNVTSITLGRPSKLALVTLWSLWPRLEELKIVSACPQIDEVLTGIPTHVCRRILTERSFNEESHRSYLDGSLPSIRDLRYLQRLEINGQLACKLQTLSCLPSDVAVYFGFIKIPELRRVCVHRSLISAEACSHLQNTLPSWASVKVEQIKFEFDETIDAFQFHRNNQHFMKLLCRYPHRRSLHMLPTFLTSLWMESRLDL